MSDIVDVQMKLSAIGRDDLTVALQEELERKDAAIAEIEEWEAIAADRAMTIAMQTLDIQDKDAAIAELTNRAISCEQSWTTERAERAELAIAELVTALQSALTIFEANGNSFANAVQIQIRAAVAKYDQ